jgi:site-specific recombinase XerD
VSSRLSRTERRLLFAYQDELRKQGNPRRLAQQLGALLAFLVWLKRRELELHQAEHQDLGAYRRDLHARGEVRRFNAVRDLYGFLRRRGLLRPDPAARIKRPRPRRKPR